jgi:succinate dehydrogenase hydrophobic anchor subunit
VFHLTNHLFGLEGPDKHAAVMKLGRKIYRSPMVEPLLVTLFLFQISSGVALAWRWSGRPATAFRVFQVASGVYLSLFVLGHINSVFVFARTFLKIQTDWGFAIGAPAGLLHDAWNIRLVPHYWLGVFFVLSHLASGVRVILTAHGTKEAVVARGWGAGLVGSAVVASLILAGMCGLRLGEHLG